MNKTEFSEIKSKIRELALARRAALSDDERRDKSRLIQRFLTELPEYRKAQTVMLYLDIRDEVETTALADDVLTKGKILVLPCCTEEGNLKTYRIRDLSSELVGGKYGIREPRYNELPEFDPKAIDLVIVPGIAFDLQGNRLGHGVGYYDRFLPRLITSVPLIALAFDCQLVSLVPVEPHDHKMTFLVTEMGIHFTGFAEESNTV